MRKTLLAGLDQKNLIALSNSTATTKTRKSTKDTKKTL